MNALGTPAAAGPADTPRPPSDRRDWLKLAGGMMFASGVLVLLARKGGDWSKGAVFLALLVGAVVLLGLAFMRVVGAGAVGGPGAPGGPGAAGWRSRAGVAAGVELGGWRSAYAVFGTLLLLGALIQLVNVLGGRPQASLNLAWTFLVAGGVAVLTSFVLRAPFQMLLGALFGVVVWLSLWDKILSHPSGDTIRWLLLVLAAIYFGVAVWLSRAGRPQASDLVTVAGLAAVLAASLSFAAAAGALNGSFSSPLGSQVPKPSQGWNVFLLVISLVLIWWGARGPIRGPGYVGAVGLAAFISLTGSDLVHRLSASGGGGGVAGWPLILLIGGAILLAAGFVLSPGALGGLGGPGGPGGPGGGPGGPGGGPGASGEPGGGGAYAAPGGTGTPLQPQMAPPPQPGYAPPAPPPAPPTAPPPAGTPPPEQPTQIHPSPGGPDQPTAARPIQPPPDQPPPGAGPPAGQS